MNEKSRCVHITRVIYSVLCVQGVVEAESVPAGVGAAGELDQSGGGGQLGAPADLVHAG